MRALRFAWRSVVRQPARSGLGILGVAAVGALLFDMLLLSRGLVLSFGDLLERSGFDVRVLASDSPAFTGPRLSNAGALVRELSGLPEIEAVLQLRVDRAELAEDEDGRGRVEFIGADPAVQSMWTIVDGEDLPDEDAAVPDVVVNRNLARRLGLSPGDTIPLRGRCAGGVAAPAVIFRVAGIADFPFDAVASRTVAGTLEGADLLCGGVPRDEAEMVLVRSRPSAGAFAAAAAIRRAHPGLYVVTNDELVERFNRVQFAYFRQISTVLATVTLFFGFLLIAVLLTVSINARLGEIAALRAIGLSRARVAAGVFWESVLLVGAGGLLALPLGAALSTWLDGILRSLPGLPAGLHFFVFEPRALVLHGVLLLVASVAAAVYPIRIVAVLPIAATLRREVVS